MDPALLFGHLDPANQFTMEGLNMAFARELNKEGKPLPKTLFLDVLVEKDPKVNRKYQTSPPWTLPNSKYWGEFSKSLGCMTITCNS